MKRTAIRGSGQWPDGRALARLETPCAVVHSERLRANIARMQAIAEEHGVALRPHVKTHKCPRIAAMQMEAGASGLTCSKSEEAAAFLEAGFGDVLAAYPLCNDRALDRVLDAARSKRARFATIAGDMASVALLDAAARRHGVTLPVFVKIDVGLHRVGLPADHPDLVALACAIHESSGLEAAGILSHAGHAYGAAGVEEIRAFAVAEARDMALAKRRIEAGGVPVPVVSVGSTPTALAAESFAGIDEIRPGNYVFLDRTAVRLGVAAADELALYVLAGVVAVNDLYVVVDAGSKALSSDMGPHGSGGAGGFGSVVSMAGGDCGVLAKLSEEHGFIARTDARDLAPGDTVLIAPNHSCSTANQAPRIVAIDKDGAVETWETVAARGLIR